MNHWTVVLQYTLLEEGTKENKAEKCQEESKKILHLAVMRQRDQQHGRCQTKHFKATC